MNKEEIISKINNAKPNEKLDFGKWIITIEIEKDDYSKEEYFIINYKKSNSWKKEWILKDANNLTRWKTLNGAKRYVLKQMEFFTGLKELEKSGGKEQ